MKLTILIILLPVFMFSYSGNSINKNNFQTRKTVSDTDYNKTTQKNVSVFSFTYQGKKYLYQNSENNCGITDEKGNIIIPNEFDYIVYPGETYKGIVEVYKNNKVGLYSFPGGKQIAPLEFDEFYPVYDNRILAYYKKGNSYNYIKKNKSDPDSNFKKYLVSPFENETVEKWNFHFPTEPYMNKEEWECFFFIPSFLKTFFDDSMQKGGDFDAEVVWPDFDFSVVGNLKENNKKYYIIKIHTNGYVWTDYLEYFVFNANMCKSFYIADINNFARYSYDYSSDIDINSGFEFKILDNSMCRIKNSVENINKKNKDYPETTLHYYNYYKIYNGKIEEIKTNRFFPFTKYERISQEFFKGFFIGERSFSEDYGSTVKVNRHLTIHDLDVMRNEIFADYGYKFKSQKWQSFFGQLNWYKPQFDNVNDKLNDIEKYNIKMILQEKRKMKNKEQYYLKTNTATISNAG